MPDDAARKPRRVPAARSAGAQQTRTDIINAAFAEFAQRGLSGASVNDVAARAQASKPMIYYYFDSKEKLYAAVMEEAYSRIRGVEQALDLDSLPPLAAMERLVEATFDYHAASPDYVRLVSIENIHDARHVTGSAEIRRQNAIVIKIVADLLARGEQAQVFRPGVDAVDLHLLISSVCYYRVSNRHTWQVLFGRDLQAPKHLQAQRRMAVEAVLAYLRPVTDPSAPEPPPAPP